MIRNTPHNIGKVENLAYLDYANSIICATFYQGIVEVQCGGVNSGTDTDCGPR